MGEALETIKKLRVVEFDWKDSNFHDVGFIAEEVAKVIPEAVFYKDDVVEGIRIVPIIAVLVKAVQELSKKEKNGK